MEKTSKEKIEAGSPKYWLSLDQWRQDPEFLKLAENEFRSSPMAEGAGEDGWARREFLKLMGASLALTTFGCVRRPAQKIVPYVKRPSEIINGISNYYASSFVDGSEGFGIIVNTREGRPIKIEGNPAHPVNKGGMSARAHAHILSLYDPDRLPEAKENLLNEERTNRDTIGISWEALDERVGTQLKEGGVAVLSGPVLSPSTSALISDFTSAFNGRHYVWEPLSQEAVVEGQRRSYGDKVFPRYRIDKAKYILAVDCDFLGTFASPVQAQYQFAQGRKPVGGMNKLVVLESLYSLTGSNADERYLIKPSQQLAAVVGLISAVSKKAGSANSQVKALVEKFPALPENLNTEVVEKIADELWVNRGQSLVMAGGLVSNTKAAVELQIAVNLLNNLLGNDGKTIDAKASAHLGFKGSYAALKQLVEDINAGKVKTLIIEAENPVFASPLELKLEEALRKVDLIVYVGTRNDDTGRLAHLIATRNHSLESWGDLEAQAGVYSIQQPTIRPLYNTRAFEDSLLSWAKAGGKANGRLATESWYEYLRAYWKNNISNQRGSIQASGFEDFWLELLQTGVFDTTNGQSSGHAGRNFNYAALSAIQPLESAPLELALYSTIGIKDGSMANNAWLQELPDPVTKICWDNYLCVSIADAAEWKILEGGMVKLQVGPQTLKLPVHIQPGQTPGVVGLAVGYGQQFVGGVANGVGVNAYKLAQYTAEGQWLTSGLPVKVEVVEGFYPLANTQGHHRMEGRQIVVEQTIAQYMKDPRSNIHKHKVFSMYEPYKYVGHKWGMVIDLNTCNGCSACVVACQSENNVPVVGKKNVLNGREMHWLRADRYYVGPPENPNIVYQPMLCQHCDTAPCEAVCPVAATVHGPEGTNDMIYNRCVGTRYCSNNCPYKVRRFNWFDYVKEVRKPLNYALNPEVTVRDRGVMEKCTFCTHRIKQSQSLARAEGRALKTDEVKVACQQSCPAGCIIFGDLNDPESEVAKAFKEAQNTYAVLEEWGTYPAIKYQTKIRNTTELKADPGHGHGHGGGEGKGHHS